MRGGIGKTAVAILLLTVGCAREHYRRCADADAGAILHQKTGATPWEIPPDFDPYPEPRSRLADPSSPDCPKLPASAPRLHAYELPQPRRPALEPAIPELHDEAVPDLQPPVAPSLGRSHALPSRTEMVHALVPAAHEEVQDQPRPSSSQPAVGLPILPIPARAWESLPRECLTRMLEFESVQREYQNTFGPGAEAPRDVARRLSLEDVIELALVNSREYQTRKEVLYRAALALTLERYEYQLKFSPTGNGTIVDYAHTRSDSTMVNTLGVTSGFGLQKMLVTGGNLLARFANDVVLTFNGPQGFAADINSELFLGFTQSLLQRDIQFEPLIQAEREVVYAARDFARYRKVFFFDRMSEYYVLLRRYRQVEIESQNYLSLVRALNQARAEEEAGLQSRVQVEQIEQGMLEGRRRVTATCNGLEGSLDRLKISMGLPTETAIALNLTELSDLNLRDETQVAAERVSRARRRMMLQREKPSPDLGELLNSAIVLNDRLIDWLRLRQRAGHEVAALHELELLVARLRVDDARLAAQRAGEELQRTRRSEPVAPPVLLFQRTIDAVEALHKLIVQQLELASALAADTQAIATIRASIEEMANRATQLRERLDAVLKGAQVQQLEALVQEASHLLTELENQVGLADRLIAAPSRPMDPEEQLRETGRQVDGLTAHTEELVETAEEGLLELQIQAEDAMLTALVSRLDLMNVRGRLADERRAIKITADDLRSVLNLRADQIIRTRHNHPLEFTFDESQTRLGLTLDLPLNRRAQRNAYRRALLDYQAALRALTESEDNIKLSIRDELRDLALARTQYQISVASAALAAERVESTRLQLALGFPGVAARDFLEAQDAFRTALGAVADDHVGYVIGRARFFLDSELMQLDQSGFWRELRHEDHQPIPRFDFPPNAGPPYGEVPECLWLSHELRETFEAQP